MKTKLGKLAIYASAIGAILLIGAQVVPVERTNPSRRDEPAWDSPRTAELVRRTCYDCHSNETRWPLYARIAPVSWWVKDHVDEGRRKLNFSEAPFREANEAGESVREGEMPLNSYTWAHPEARLNAIKKSELIAGLERTFRREL